MSQIIIKKIQNTMVSTPASNYISLFSDMSKDGALSYVGSDGVPRKVSESNYEEITYADIYQKYNNQLLETGKYYIITDFQSIYEQPDYYVNGTQRPSLVRSSNISKIMVFAVSNSYLSPDAYRIDSYQMDKIKYDITWNYTEFDSPARGRIVETIDEFGNITDYDHRDIEFKRYMEWVPNPDIDTSLSTIYEYTCADGILVGSAFSYINLSPEDVILIDVENYTIGLKIKEIQSDTQILVYTDESIDDPTQFNFSSSTSLTFSVAKTDNIYNGYKEFYIGQSGFGEYQSYKTFDTDCSNNTIGNYSNIVDQNVFILSNNVFGIDCKGNQIFNSRNNTFGMGSSFNKCEKLSNNTIGDGFCDNIISTGVGFKNNRIYNDFKNNNISVYSFDSNYIESNFSFNVLSSEEFSGNYIGGSCSNNLIYAVVTNCTLGQQVLNNIFESCDITSMNLISSQHLSQNYNCRIFSRFGGELRISYVDEDDLILITYLGA